MILVTGATGTVGSELVRQLVDDHQPVRVLVRDERKMAYLAGAVEVIVGDLDQPDTVAAAMQGVSGVFLVTFQASQDYPTGASPRVMTAADLNRDGNVDLIYTSYSNNQVSVRLGNGDGTFQNALNLGVGSRPIGVTTADINGDGKLDLITSDYFSISATILLGNGDGTFQPPLTASSSGLARNVAAADVNLDGKLACGR